MFEPLSTPCVKQVAQYECSQELQTNTTTISAANKRFFFYIFLFKKINIVRASVTLLLEDAKLLAATETRSTALLVAQSLQLLDAARLSSMCQIGILKKKLKPDSNGENTHAQNNKRAYFDEIDRPYVFQR